MLARARVCRLKQDPRLDLPSDLVCQLQTCRSHGAASSTVATVGGDAYQVAPGMRPVLKLSLLLEMSMEHNSLRSAHFVFGRQSPLQLELKPFVCEFFPLSKASGDDCYSAATPVC